MCNLSPNVSTIPFWQWDFRQCLPFSWTSLRGKHCRYPFVLIRVVNTFRLCVFWYSWWFWQRWYPLFWRRILLLIGIWNDNDCSDCCHHRLCPWKKLLHYQSSRRVNNSPSYLQYFCKFLQFILFGYLAIKSIFTIPHGML